MEHGTIIKEANGNFAFHFWIAKASAVEEAGKMVVEGVASTPNVDHDKERMAPEALKAMARIINTSGVPLRVEHSQKDNAVIGNVNKAWVDERNQLWIKATLDESHPASGILYKGLKDGVKMGLSVGGYVKRAVQEMVEGLGKTVNTFYDVLLDEVSVTQKPSNYDARLMAKSFAKSEGEVDALAGAFESSEFLFNSAMGGSDYLTAFAKSIPEDAWVQKDYKLDKDNNMTTETKEKTTKAEETDEKKTKSEEKDEDKTTKAEEKDDEKTTKTSDKKEEDKTEKSVSRSEFNDLVKMVSEGFNALTSGISKMAKAMETDAKDQQQPDKEKRDPEEGKEANKMSGGEAKDEEHPSKDKRDPEEGKQANKAADGTDETGERERKTKAEDKKDDTYDLETVERAIKRIKAVTKAFGEDDTEDKKKTKSEDKTEDRTEKSAKMSSIDEFVVTVADSIERMEKSMKEGGFQTDHIAKTMINQIRSNPEFRKDIAAMMAEPGAKRSVVSGTPFVKMKDGRTFELMLRDVGGERTEKSATEAKPGPGAFRAAWGSKFSSAPAATE